MGINDRFTAIRKGLLEFLILKIVATGKVYVADILGRLSDTEFATQEGTLYPLLSKMRRDGLLHYEGQGWDAAARWPARLRVAGVGRRAAAQVLRADRPRPRTAGGTQRLLEAPQYDGR